MGQSSAFVLANSADALALFRAGLAGEGRERLCIAYLDGAGRPLRLASHLGDRTMVDLPLRAIIAEALALDAGAMLIAHNHPSGDPGPSRADLLATRRLVDALRPLDIRLIDHIIVAHGGWRSLRAMGLL